MQEWVQSDQELLVIHFGIILLSGCAHHQQVVGYLQEIGTDKLIDLGLTLGLSRMDLKRSLPKELVGDLVTSWIRRDNDVLDVSGAPTWRSLAKALLRVKLTGISLDIQRDFKFEL